MGAEAQIRLCDLADPAAVSALAASLPPLDGMVLNAGRANDRPFLSVDQGAITQELQLNYLTPAALLRHALPAMRQRGRGTVVAVGSLTSFVPFPGNATYAASKSALYTLIRSLRLELEGSGVSVGVVLPGLTDTAMTKRLRTSGPTMSADAVGRAVARCYEQRQAVVVPGLMNRAAASVFGAFPATLDALLARFGDGLIPKSDA